MARDHGYWRSHIFTRDKGVCGSCGVDCVALRREYLRLGQSVGWDAARAFSIKHNGHVVSRDGWWHADHVIAKCLGGTNKMENGMTLCVPCHKAKTKNDRRLLKEKKNSQKTVDALPLSSVTS